MKSLPVALLPFLLPFSAPLVMLAVSAPQPGAPVLVVSNWGFATEIKVAALDGEVIGAVGAPYGILAQSDDPEFARRLRDAGAWLTFDGRLIAALWGT